MSDREKQRIIILWMRWGLFTALNNEHKIQSEKKTNTNVLPIKNAITLIFKYSLIFCCVFDSRHHWSLELCFVFRRIHFAMCDSVFCVFINEFLSMVKLSAFYELITTPHSAHHTYIQGAIVVTVVFIRLSVLRKMKKKISCIGYWVRALLWSNGPVRGISRKVLLASVTSIFETTLNEGDNETKINSTRNRFLGGK